MDENIMITFLLQRHLAFLKDLFFVFVSFVLVAICIAVSLLGNKQVWVKLDIRIEKIISAPILPKKFFLEVPTLLAVRHCPTLMEPLENGKTPTLISNSIWGPPNFFSWVLSRQCSKLLSYAIFRKTNELNLKK